MKTSLTTSKDNVLMSVLIAVSLLVPSLGPLLAGEEAQSAVNSAGRAVKSVGTPTPVAMEPIQYREAAIIVTAPRLRTSA